MSEQRCFLNVGCGAAGRDRMPLTLQDTAWEEIRVDLDPQFNPDVVGSFSDLHMIHDKSVDAVWSSHNIEHMLMHESRMALREALRVLKPDGFFFLTLPDLTMIARLVADGRLMETLYTSPAGPITPLDMLFGLQSAQENGNSLMAHRSGYTGESLADELRGAGFTQIKVVHGKNYDLWALASTCTLPDRIIDEFLANRGR